MGQGVQNVGQWFHSQGGVIVDVTLRDHFGNQGRDSVSPPLSKADHNSLVGLNDVTSLDAAAAAIGGPFAAWWSTRGSTFKGDVLTALIAWP